MGSKTPKKSQSAFRAGSAANKDATSLAASAALQEKKKVIIWPEWSDADINAEKWEGTHNKKDKEKGKSPVTQQHFFEDPDGKVEYPPSLKVATWKRPQEYLLEKVPVIVEPNSQGDFNLLSEANETVHESELMRWITSQITALWKQSATKPPPPEAIDPAFPPVLDPQGNIHTWHPWEHIFAINKVVKGPYMPAYNPFGKYVVKLYWMGCWRKIYVDDTLPFDEQGRLLLPSTTLDHEIWPHLLTKALLKVASIDYNGGNSSCEFGDFSVIQCLTGWLPETIPLQYGHLPEIWNMLKQALPEFKLPELEPEKPPENLEVPKDPTISPEGTEEAKDKEIKDKPSEIKSEGKPAKEEKKGKGKEDKKKDKEKNKELKEKSMMQEDIPLPEHPEIMVFAAYSGPPKYPVRISVLGEMADASERLRQSGLSHLYPHPVLVKQTRSCPLEPPPPPFSL